MLGIKKTASKIDTNSVPIAMCPLCESITVHLYYMKDAKTAKMSKWYSCSCGIIWQTPYPDFKYDKNYIVPEGKKFEAASKYFVKVNLPLSKKQCMGANVK